MTKGEFVSTLQQDLRLNNKDTYISRRHILTVGESYAQTFLAQRLDENKLEGEASLVVTIPCFEMESVDAIECGFANIRECRDIMKSVKKLPKTIQGNSGYAIFGVYSIDDTVEYKFTSRARYKDKMKSKYIRNKGEYYFIEDEYLYLPNETNEMVKIYMVALDEEEVEEACEECNSNGGTKDSVKCKSLWDEKFICPDKLLMGVRQATLQELLPMVQIPKDENPNMNSNLK